jgi:hypothetical protein
VRIAFKSLLVLHESRSTCGNTTTVRTVYDMNSVRDHELETSWPALALGPEAAWRVAVMMPGLLMFFWSDGNPLAHPGIFLGGCLPFLLLFWFLAYHSARTVALEAHARAERGLPPEAKVRVVEADRWAGFLAALKPPDALSRLQMETERGLQGIREAIRQLEKQQQAGESGNPNAPEGR